MPPKPKKPLPAPAGPCKRIEVTYKGRVQGVGFRFNVEKVALEVGAKGWVRNEKNGDVMVVAEGPEPVLLALLEGVRQSQVGRYIAKEHLRWETPLHQFDDFTIEYHF